jgi:DNA-binding NarL/FixJ family response regulator
VHRLQGKQRTDEQTEPDDERSYIKRKQRAVHAVRVAAAGEALLAPSITKRLIASFAPQASPAAYSLPDLTPRETEVLTLLAEGLSNVEIADRLFVSDATVKTHVAHILTKLGVRDRVQAVVIAYRSGLVPTDPQ